METRTTFDILSFFTGRADDCVNVIDFLGSLDSGKVCSALMEELSLSEYEILLYTKECFVSEALIWRTIAERLQSSIRAYEWEQAAEAKRIEDAKRGPMCTIWSHKTGGVNCYSGYTYVGRCGDLYKIGFTCSSQGLKTGFINRVYDISSKYGIIISFTHAIYSTCARGLERYFHNKFQDKRIKSEFFGLSDDDLDFIRKLEKFNEAKVEHVVALEA